LDLICPLNVSALQDSCDVADDFDRTIAKIAEPDFFLYIMISTAIHMLIYIMAIVIEHTVATKFHRMASSPQLLHFPSPTQVPTDESDPLIQSPRVSVPSEDEAFVRDIVPSSPPHIPILTILYSLAGGFFGSHTLFMAKVG
jgi:hypothetical protein